MKQSHSGLSWHHAPSIAGAVVAVIVAIFVDATLAGQGQTKSVPGASASLLIERDAERGARSYSINEGDCHLSLIAFDSPPNRGIVQDRSVCTSSLSAQVSARSRLLSAILSDSESREQPRTFVWGRLTPDRRRDDLEMAFRLALAAHRSPSWDAKRGGPRSGQINDLVAKLADQNSIYEELRRSFNAVGLELKFTSAEKVLVMSAGTLSFFDRLRDSGVDPAEKLPCDCLAYFSISKMPASK